MSSSTANKAINLNTAKAKEESQGSTSQFRSTPKGLLKMTKGGPRKICSPIKIIAITRDQDNDSWGRLVAVQNREGEWKEFFIPPAMIAGKTAALMENLVSLDLRLASSAGKNKQDLMDYLINADVPERVLMVSRPGWHGDSFLLPYRMFSRAGGQGENIRMKNSDLAVSHVGTLGTLEQWKEAVGRYLPGNHLLMFAASVAFAPVLLDLLNDQDGVGFHFVGSSSIGKTTLLRVGGSIWGGGGSSGYLHSWRTTDNALEKVAQAYNDGLLCLDEIGEVGSKAAGEIGYMLANGEGKARSTAEGLSIKPAAWRLIYLSSGEVTLSQKMAERGARIRGGQEARLINIPADAGSDMGVFNQINGMDSSAGLARHLKQATDLFYGTPMEAFLKRLVGYKADTRSRMVNWLRERKEDFLRDLLPEDCSGQVERVSDKFALVAAAGELAIHFEIIPAKEGEAIQAARHCYQSWLENRGGTGDQEDAAMLSAITLFIQKYQDSRFMREGVDQKTIHNMAGIIKTLQSGNFGGQTFFALFPNVFQEEVCQGYNFHMALRMLKERGLLLVSGEGRNDHKLRYGDQSGRFYCISNSILTIDGSGQEEDMAEEVDEEVPDDF